MLPIPCAGRDSMSDRGFPVDRVAEPPGPAWTPERLSVRRLLATNAPPLVETYVAALRMLDNPSFPSRRLLVAHCVREIANSLPEFFAGATRGRIDYKAHCDRISGPWRDAGLPVGEELLPTRIGDALPGGPVSAQVPAAIVREVAKLLEEHERATSRVHRKAEVIFRALDPVGNTGEQYQTATLRLWIETVDWFQKNAHYNRRTSEDSIGHLDDELSHKFEQFERVLGTLAQPFLDIVNSLDEDLVQANS
jgi:hypothetical protein